jgi:hypothetical protein
MKLRLFVIALHWSLFCSPFLKNEVERGVENFTCLVGVLLVILDEYIHYFLKKLKFKNHLKKN